MAQEFLYEKVPYRKLDNFLDGRDTELRALGSSTVDTLFASVWGLAGFWDSGHFFNFMSKSEPFKPLCRA